MEAYRKRSQARLLNLFLTAIFIVFLGSGCSSRRVSYPPRTATEQLLLSTAADQALSQANFKIFSGRNVYLDFTYFDSYDSKYVESKLRDAFSRDGALLMPDAKSADIIVEARSGAYSVDNASSFIGIPRIPVPIPSTSEIPIIPQISFWSRDSDRSYAKFGLFAYSKKTYAHIYSSGTLDGTAFNTYRSFMFISWRRSDIPEKARRRDRQKSEDWTQQYDLNNLPPPASTNKP
jgi:hypothetical protein